MCVRERERDLTEDKVVKSHGAKEPGVCVGESVCLRESVCVSEGV